MIVEIGGDRFEVVESEDKIDLSKRGLSGWIVLHPEELIYINYLGKRVSFCGNATRVVGYINAKSRGLNEYTVYANGPKRVFINGDIVGIEVDVDYKNFGEFSVVKLEGVSHIVFYKKNGDLPIKVLAKGLQKSLEGYHINYYYNYENKLFVRTWEYGYIYEPGGCATGGLSCGVDWIMRKGLICVVIKTLSGDYGRVFIKGEKFVLENKIFFYT